MEWRGGRRGGNIEDRRGMGGGAMVGGGVGILGIAAVLIGVFVFDMDPQQAMDLVGGAGGGTVPAQEGKRGTPRIRRVVLPALARQRDEQGANDRSGSDPTSHNSGRPTV